MKETFGYSWLADGTSGYEYFFSAEARSADIAERVDQSPEPKPRIITWECDREAGAEDLACEKMDQLEAREKLTA